MWPPRLRFRHRRIGRRCEIDEAAIQRVRRRRRRICRRKPHRDVAPIILRHRPGDWPLPFESDNLYSPVVRRAPARDHVHRAYRRIRERPRRPAANRHLRRRPRRRRHHRDPCTKTKNNNESWKSSVHPPPAKIFHKGASTMNLLVPQKQVASSITPQQFRDTPEYRGRDLSSECVTAGRENPKYPATARRPSLRASAAHLRGWTWRA